MLDKKLRSAKEITMKKLYKLSDDPEYLSQTIPDDNSDYWMFFEIEGIHCL